MVIVICILFILLTTPMISFYVIVYDLGMFTYIATGGLFSLIRAPLLILALSNHAINFVLYAVTSSNFRQEFKNLFGEMKPKCRPTISLRNVSETAQTSGSSLPGNNHI